MKENNVKERIVELLRYNPQGLTILEISRLVGVNRITVSKYIYVLISEDAVSQRKVGPAKLCCLKVVE